MKKIALLLILTLSLFSLVQETGAVTYGGNNSFFLPVFQGPTGEDYGTVGGNPNAYGFVAQQGATQYAIMQKYNTAGTYFFSYAIAIRIQKTGDASTYSGSIIQFGNNSECGDTSCIVALGFDIVQTPFTGGLHYTLRILSSNYFNTPINEVLTIDLHDYNQTNCAQGGTDSDCIYLIKPNFIVSNLAGSVGTYFTSIDTYFYSEGTQVKHVSYNSNGNAIGQTYYQTFLDLFYNNQNFGSLISTNTDFTTGYSHYFSDTSVSPVTVKMYAGADVTARSTDTYITQFLTSFSGAIDSTLPNWLGATSIVTQGQSGTGSTGTGTDYFASCGSFLEVGCYVKGASDTIVSEIKGAFTSIFSLLFPDINFNGMSETCISNASSGALTSTTSLPFLQKVSNLFVILVPVAPPNNSDVCTFEGIKHIEYKSDTAGVLDILFVLFAFVPLLFAIKPHHD